MKRLLLHLLMFAFAVFVVVGILVAPSHAKGGGGGGGGHGGGGHSSSSHGGGESSHPSGHGEEGEAPVGVAVGEAHPHIENRAAHGNAPAESEASEAEKAEAAEQTKEKWSMGLGVVAVLGFLTYLMAD